MGARARSRRARPESGPGRRRDWTLSVSRSARTPRRRPDPPPLASRSHAPGLSHRQRQRQGASQGARQRAETSAQSTDHSAQCTVGVAQTTLVCVPVMCCENRSNLWTYVRCCECERRILRTARWPVGPGSHAIHHLCPSRLACSARARRLRHILRQKN